MVTFLFHPAGSSMNLAFKGKPNETYLRESWEKIKEKREKDPELEFLCDAPVFVYPNEGDKTYVEVSFNAGGSGAGDGGRGISHVLEHVMARHSICHFGSFSNAVVGSRSMDFHTYVPVTDLQRQDRLLPRLRDFLRFDDSHFDVMRGRAENEMGREFSGLILSELFGIPSSGGDTPTISCVSREEVTRRAGELPGYFDSARVVGPKAAQASLHLKDNLQRLGVSPGVEEVRVSGRKRETAGVLSEDDGYAYAMTFLEGKYDYLSLVVANEIMREPIHGDIDVSDSCRAYLVTYDIVHPRLFDREGSVCQPLIQLRVRGSPDPKESMGRFVDSCREILSGTIEVREVDAYVCAHNVYANAMPRSLYDYRYEELGTVDRGFRAVYEADSLGDLANEIKGRIEPVARSFLRSLELRGDDMVEYMEPKEAWNERYDAGELGIRHPPCRGE